MKIQGDLGAVTLISDTSYYHRKEETGYDGTLYNLGFYQAQPSAQAAAQGALPVFPNGSWFPLLDGTGLHLPPGATNYRAPASVDNDQDNLTEEIRLQSADPAARLIWTTGLFFSADRQTYLEQIHDPLLNDLTQAVLGLPYTQVFTDASGNPVPYDPHFPNDSYFLQTYSKDRQYALFGEGTFSFTDQLKATLGARFSQTEFSFHTLTGGPQLFLANQTNSGDKKENSFTPKASLQYQYDPHDLYYFTYAKGFRPGGANNPVPAAACGTDFANFGIKNSPATFNSDTVDSFEIGAKNNLDNRVKIASSVYYIRWHNIQQVVVPPICQISFIDNLGQAVAKGADMQGEFALTDSFTAELSAGYTQARYTQDARLSPAETTPHRRQRRCHRGSERAAGAPGHGLAGPRVSLRARRPRLVRALRRRIRKPAQMGGRESGREYPAIRFGQLLPAGDELRLGSRRTEDRRTGRSRPSATTCSTPIRSPTTNGRSTRAWRAPAVCSATSRSGPAPSA